MKGGAEMTQTMSRPMVPWMTAERQFHVRVETDRHRVLEASGTNEHDARAMHSARARNRFHEALQQEGISVPVGGVRVALFTMNVKQKKQALKRCRRMGVAPKGTSIDEFVGWIPVAYALVGTTLYLHDRNLSALDMDQGRRFAEDYLAPLIRTELGEGAHVAVASIECG